MGVDVPSNYTIDLDVDGQMVVSGDLDLDVNADIRIPTSYGIGIDRIPKIQLGLDPVELRPLDLSLRLKEIPSIRMHLPADFKVGLALLGRELLTIRLCGEAQIITEDYHANPCEVCGGGERQLTVNAVLGRLDLDQPNG